MMVGSSSAASAAAAGGLRCVRPTMRSKPSELALSHALPGARRRFTSITTTQQDDEQQRRLSASVRALMRSSAQPVAVISTILPSERHAHGATLSSFTTVSLDPPLVAFSLKTPSRLADALLHAAAAAAKAPELNPSSRPHFVINVLSVAQTDAAKGFAKPGLSPFPLPDAWIGRSKKDADDAIGGFDRDTNDHSAASHPFSLVDIHASEYALSPDGVPVPVMSKSIGALACSVVNRVHLAHPSALSQNDAVGASDLFMARIHAVEDVKKEGTGTEEHRLPLLYWERMFTTIKQ